MTRVAGWVKWYGGYNTKTERDNEYGFIVHPGGDDIFVHALQVKCAITSLKEDVPVSFEILENTHKGKAEAQELILLEQEEDGEVLASCFRSPYERIWKTVAAKYLLSLPLEQAISEAIQKKRSLPSTEGRTLAHNIPSQIMLAIPARPLREVLAPSVRVSLCKLMLKNAQDEQSRSQIENEMIVALKDELSDPQTSYSTELWRDLPDQILLSPKLWPHIPAQTRITRLVQFVSEGRDIEEIVSEIVKVLDATRERQSILKTVPAEIALHSSLWRFYDPDQLIDILWSSLVGCVNSYWSELPRDAKISCICRLIKEKVVVNIEPANDEDGKVKCLLAFYWAITKQLDQEEASGRVINLSVCAHPLQRVLSPAMFIDYCKQVLVSVGDRQDLSQIVVELGKGLLKVTNGQQFPSYDIAKLWEHLPDYVLLSPNVWPCAPVHVRIERLVQFVAEGHTLEETIGKIDEILNTIDDAWRIQSVLEELPSDIAHHQLLWHHYTPVELVEIIYGLSDNELKSCWAHVPQDAKVLYVYWLAKEETLFDIKILEEEDELVKCALILYWAIANQPKRKEVFTKAHNYFQDYVLGHAWDSLEPLALPPLLPLCPDPLVKPRYCDGAPWPTEEDKEHKSRWVSRAYCPSEHASCRVHGRYIADKKYEREGARLYPNTNLDWQEWCLMELLKAARIEPALPDLKKSEEYVQKLAGWINRLNEIRERLACSSCGQVMVPNYEYAKSLAAHRVTVVSCKGGDGHDKDVYLTHCWACEKIIDSRNNIIRIEGYYLCLYCGSGPQISNSFVQGSICPKCGGKDMVQTYESSRSVTCGQCKHSIHLPPEHKLTGQR